MKINQHGIPNRENMKAELKGSVTTKRFDSFVQTSRSKLQETQLQQLLSEVEEQGNRLARSRNFKDLVRFKSLVKDFVRETVDHGLNLKQSKSWDAEGYQETTRIVQTIDEKLVQLTDSLLNNEQENVALLDQIGEIKGLLVNLYI